MLFEIAMVKSVFKMQACILGLRFLVISVLWIPIELCLIQVNSHFITTLIAWQHNSVHTEGQKVDMEAHVGSLLENGTALEEVEGQWKKWWCWTQGGN